MFVFAINTIWDWVPRPGDRSQDCVLVQGLASLVHHRPVVSIASRKEKPNHVVRHRERGVTLKWKCKDSLRECEIGARKQKRNRSCAGQSATTLPSLSASPRDPSFWRESINTLSFEARAEVGAGSQQAWRKTNEENYQSRKKGREVCFCERGEDAGETARGGDEDPRHRLCTVWCPSTKGKKKRPHKARQGCKGLKKGLQSGVWFIKWAQLLLLRLLSDNILLKPYVPSISFCCYMLITFLFVFFLRLKYCCIRHFIGTFLQWATPSYLLGSVLYESSSFFKPSLLMKASQHWMFDLVWFCRSSFRQTSETRQQCWAF